MSGASSGDDSEPVPEVPTEVPSDLEDVASGEGMPAPSGPTKQRLVLDKAYRYLLDQGFGIPELASLDLDEVPAMARQLAEELAIPLGDWLEEAILLATRSTAGS